MQKWEQRFPLARLQHGAELAVSLSSGQEQLGEPVLPATRILPRPDEFANPSPAAMRSGTGSSLFCCGIACGFQQVFICKTHPWVGLKFRGKVLPKALGDTNHKGRVLPFLWAVQRCRSGRGGGSAGAPPLLHLPRMWLQWGHLHEEHSEVVFFQEAKPTPVLYLRW